MKLRLVQRDTMCRLPASDIDGEALTFKFHHIDGMYSYCTTEEGEVFHLSANTEVEVLNQEIN